jgi:hypothetical protein
MKAWFAFGKHTPDGRDHYLLEVPRGAEIVAGMLISNVPPEAEPGQTGE